MTILDMSTICDSIDKFSPNEIQGVHQVLDLPKTVIPKLTIIITVGGFWL